VGCGNRGAVGDGSLPAPPGPGSRVEVGWAGSRGWEIAVYDTQSNWMTSMENGFILLKRPVGNVPMTLDKYHLNLAGEYLIAAELLKGGIFATITYGNKKGADIYAIGPNRRTAVVEVKTSNSQRFVTGFYRSTRSRLKSIQTSGCCTGSPWTATRTSTC
jgi:hypothetical protein